MLHTSIQSNAYQSNLNNFVSQAVSGAKPELVAPEKKPEYAEHARRATKPQAKEHITSKQATKPLAKEHTTLSKESVNKAIDDKVAEFFTKYPNGGSDQDVAQFLENVRSMGA
jgi:hypothetical protein